MAQDHDIRERAKEMIIEIDQHYNMLIKEAWEIIEQSKNVNDRKVWNDAIKSAAQFA
jgi:hypothetical protein